MCGSRKGSPLTGSIVFRVSGELQVEPEQLEVQPGLEVHQVQQVQRLVLLPFLFGFNSS